MKKQILNAIFILSVLAATSCTLRTQNQTGVSAFTVTDFHSDQTPSATQQSTVFSQSIKPSEAQDPCGDAMTQRDMNDCAEVERKKADAELQQRYGFLISNLEPNYQDSLKNAQRKWMEYRDVNCRSDAEYHNGSVSPMVYSYCSRRMTINRLEELTRIYDDLVR